VERVRVFRSLKDLAVVLEKLEDFDRPVEVLEQYRTPGDVAATLAWEAMLRGDLEGRVVIDLGCGTGVIAYGFLALGARQAICVDVDWRALGIARENLRDFEGFVELVAADVRYFHTAIPRDACTVAMNPPFGVKRRGADLEFLRVALGLCDTVYSIHKYVPRSMELLESTARSYGFRATTLARVWMTIKQRFKHHRRRVYRFKVELIRFVKERSEVG
jgi:putative methylase